jgi:hypothetical protein
MHNTWQNTAAPLFRAEEAATDGLRAVDGPPALFREVQE